MRNTTIESLVLGCGIALGVLLVHALTQGAPATRQLLALLAVGLVLFCIQIGLTLRRVRRGGQPAKQQAEPAQRARLSSRTRGNPFFRELTHDWTGLDDQPAERDSAGQYAPGDLDDDLWPDQPPIAPRKAVAKADGEHQRSAEH